MSNNLKGNAVIGQSGGPTAVINQSLVGVIQEAKKAGHILDLLGASDVVLLPSETLYAKMDLPLVLLGFHPVLVLLTVLAMVDKWGL